MLFMMEWDMCNVNELVSLLLNFNGYVERHVDGFYAVYEMFIVDL